MKLPRSLRLLTVLFAFWATAFCARAQTCDIVNIDTIICQGTSVSFSVNTTGGTPTTYAWDFGNGFTANTATPSHTYTTPGTFTPKVIVTFSGGGSCTSFGLPIRVFATPNAGFAITTSRKMCFKDNELCIQDFSTPGSSNAPIKRRVYQLSNGFLQIDTPPYASTICYKDSTDVLGHVFSLVMEVTDTNNCVGKALKIDSVELYPKFEKLDFTRVITQYCFKTTVVFTNTSLMPTSRVQKFAWHFGDGVVDSINWLSTTHDYTGHGNYAPLLIIKDIQGCIDTVKPKDTLFVLFPDSAIFMQKPTTQCYRGNVFECSSINPDGLYNFNWNVTDKDGNIIPILQAPPSYIRFRTPTCGRFKVRLTVSLASCVIITDSFIDVLGPKAVMEEGKYKVTNGKQCHIRDTVFFVTPNPYLSCVHKNGLGLKHLWDFDDDFAPQCTVDTRKGINIGMNCNYSRDSNIVNHVYKPGEEKCYYPSLYMVDTIQGCDDSTSVRMPLMPPDASPAPNAIPPRRGLYTLDSLRCFGETVGYTFEVLPACDYSRAYVNVDSACGINNWVLSDTTGAYVFTHQYNSTCGKDGYVSVGLIIANGYPQSGNVCYDTSWFHHIIRLSPITPEYTMKLNNDCEPYSVTFIPKDSIQYNLTKAYWHFGSNDTATQYFSPTDSIVQSHTTVFPTAGVYNTFSFFTNTISCFGSDFLAFAVGFNSKFTASKSPVCLFDSVGLYADVYYWSAIYPQSKYPVNFWGMPSRAAAGKENIWWDIGDGNGFVYTGDTVNVYFTKPGKYTIKMLVKDSAGCYDTIVKPDYITVIDAEAHIAQIKQQYFCAPQIVLFKDSSLVFDSVPYTVPSVLDAITVWRWDFGDNTMESFLKDAGHNYTSNGSFTTRLIVTTSNGCSDTDYAQVNIAGPTPSFTISDTIGCDPFSVLFDNTTGQPLKSWTWYFGDSANQTFTTLTDSSVKFTYNKPGTYYIKLLGSQDVTNPSTGNTVNCNQFFPDPVTGLPMRKVVVLPTPPVGLEIVDSACIDEVISLNSFSDSSYTQFVWKMSNGDEVIMNKPDSVSSYSFDSSGVYRIILTGTQNPSTTCFDSDTAEIRIMDVNANFEIDSSKSPMYRFHNTSTKATRYIWNYGKPQAGASNEATSTDGEFYFGSDTGTYSVCLMAFNELDCMDSICQDIRINQIRLTIPNVFTPDNNDGYNDAFDIDILGFTEYHLVIYNRWGAKVFEGLQDGYKNDGINWNGNDHQTGPPCAAGTYYFIFTYKFYTESKSETAHGTITLIRNK